MDLVTIAPAVPEDRDGLVRLAGELLDFERYLYHGRQPGALVAAQHVAELLSSAAAGAGAIFVARVGGELAGYVAGWMAMDGNTLLMPEAAVHGFISDVYVTPRWRGKDIAEKLLYAIETHLAAQGAQRLRTVSLARNAGAIAAYRGFGFEPYEIVFEKNL